MNLEGVGEHDQDHDGETTDGRCGGSWVHADDVAGNIVAIGEISGNTSQDIKSACSPDAGKDDAGSAEVRVVGDLIEDRKHILMASVCKYNDRECRKSGYRTCPSEHSDFALVLQGITLDEVSEDKNDQICNRAESNNARIFQRIKTS